MAAFAPGDIALLTDLRDRTYLVELREGGEFHTHNGFLGHDAVLGRHPGVVLYTTGGSRITAFRPRLADFVLKMPRAATVMYPKDVGPVLVYGDIAPGCTVVEAGTGSGGLTLALLRAVGESGRVISFEPRDDHRAAAERNIRRFCGGALPPNLELRPGNVQDGLGALRADRVVLDLPEPWTVAEAAAHALADGGVWVSYVPTVPQVGETVAELRRVGRYADIETLEVLLRTWHVDGRSIRPDHRMVAHTGFLTVARFADEPPNRTSPSGTSPKGQQSPEHSDGR